ncbi:integrase catalytic subunit [Calderihabitans maritimus]|uniref:Integrase catalytic subunit n=1 Tax=Calderihabitans maritimus TaxID=1246530 RepID=A0A1Z5HY64_9FIRM|nr:integrase catalytic subunit [Calderihabitans maritimus]
MEEKDREAIALFRYGLIAPVLNGQVASQKEYLEEVTGKKHQVPYYGPREFTPKTLACWILAYRREGFEGLKPKRRSDRGRSRKLSAEQEEYLLFLRKQKRDVPASVFYDQLVDKGEILPGEVSYATVYRLLKKHGLVGKEVAKTPERKRFAYDTVNTLWQGDMSVGPYLFAQFFFSEKFDSLKTVFKSEGVFPKWSTTVRFIARILFM